MLLFNALCLNFEPAHEHWLDFPNTLHLSKWSKCVYSITKVKSCLFFFCFLLKKITIALPKKKCFRSTTVFNIDNNNKKKIKKREHQYISPKTGNVSHEMHHFYCIFWGSIRTFFFFFSSDFLSLMSYDSLVCLEYAGHMICLKLFVIN